VQNKLTMAGQANFLLTLFIPLIGRSQVYHRKINQWNAKYHKLG